MRVRQETTLASRGMKRIKTIACLLVVGALAISCLPSKDWREASRQSSGLAPDPAEHHEAVIQVYGARAWGWRGWFAIHTWIAAKRKGADSYVVYDVVGWREKRGLPVLGVSRDVPDRYWYGEKPEILAALEGPGVDTVIDRIEEAARGYPWKTTYKVFPGPNSNTFTAWIAREVPELNLDLPFTAIGSGYVN